MPDKRLKNPFSDGFIDSSVMKVLRNAFQAGSGKLLDGTMQHMEPEYLEQADPREIKLMFEDILLTDNPDIALIYLKLAGFHAYCFPEIDALSELNDGSNDYKDVWDHTLKVVAQTPKKNILRWAALFHDIGKLKTKEANEKGEIHFIGHEGVGAGMSVKIMKRLRFPRWEAEKIRFLVLNHLRCGQYDSSWTDSAVRRLGRELGEHFEDQIELSRADITTKHIRRKEKYFQLLDELSVRHRKIQEEDSRPPLLPAGLGNHIMKTFNLPPGPEVGRIRNALELLVEAGKLKAGQDSEYYTNYLNGKSNIVNNDGRKGLRKNKFPV